MSEETKPFTDDELRGCLDPTKNGPVLIRMARELLEARKDRERLEFVMEHRGGLWNRQISNRESVDAAMEDINS